MTEPGGPSDPNQRFLADVLTFGWVLPAAIAAGAGLGYLGDRLLSSFPWLTVLGGGLGFAGGIREVLKRAASFGGDGDRQG